MKNNKYVLDQLQDFCTERKPYEVKENTRNIIIALLQSDFFNAMDNFTKVAFVEYIYQIEDILLGAYDDLNLEIK
jgi:hypothetical protein